LYLTLPPREFPLEFCNGGGSDYWNDATTRIPVLKKFDDISIRFDAIPALDRQTDRQTDIIGKNNIAFCMHMA